MTSENGSTFLEFPPPIIKKWVNGNTVASEDLEAEMRAWIRLWDAGKVNGLHSCSDVNTSAEGPGTPADGYGPAITDCSESKDRTLWAGNDEYSTQVNFCPFCGFEAKVKHDKWKRTL